jgi:hypothetical protein
MTKTMDTKACRSELEKMLNPCISSVKVLAPYYRNLLPLAHLEENPKFPETIDQTTSVVSLDAGSL